MKIAVIGANGQIGQRIVQEALGRGHQVTAVVRDPSKLNIHDENLSVATADVTDPGQVAAAVAAHDAVVSAIGPNHAVGNYHVLTDAARSLITGLKRAGVGRLVVVGGAGGLEVSPGVRLVDTDALPESIKPFIRVGIDALGIYRAEKELDWTYFSPAGTIEPGQRTGSFRLGGEQLITDAAGRSHISIEDYALALVDELENPKHSRQRFTIGY